MEITINVSDSQFNDVLQKELNAFDKEELKSIIREGLIKCISDSKNFEGLFVKTYDYYSNQHKAATDILIDAAKTINLSPVFDEFEQKARQWIMDNHSDIIRKILTDFLLQGLSTRMFSSDFTEGLKRNILYEISPRN